MNNQTWVRLPCNKIIAKVQHFHCSTSEMNNQIWAPLLCNLIIDNAQHRPPMKTSIIIIWMKIQFLLLSPAIKRLYKALHLLLISFSIQRWTRITRKKVKNRKYLSKMFIKNQNLMSTRSGNKVHLSNSTKPMWIKMALIHTQMTKNEAFIRIDGNEWFYLYKCTF